MSLLFLRNVDQDVPRLTVRGGANGLQRGEAHRLGFVIFQNGEIGQGDVHLLRELGEGHLPFCHHHVQIDHDCHARAPLNSQIVFRLHLRCLTEERGHHKAEKPCHGEDGNEEGVIAQKGHCRAEQTYIECHPDQSRTGDDEGAQGGPFQADGVFHGERFTPENGAQYAAPLPEDHRRTAAGKQQKQRQQTRSFPFKKRWVSYA